MAFDEKGIASSNTIKKVLDSTSLVSTRLAEAQAEIEKTVNKKASDKTSSLKKGIIEEISKYRNNIKSNIDNLFTHRIKLFENLMSAIFGKFYADAILSQLNKYKSSVAAIETLSKKSGEDDMINTIIQEMIDCLDFLENYELEENEILHKDACEKLNYLAGKLEEIFNLLKDQLGFEDVEVDENGNLTGLGRIYNAPGIKNNTIPFKSTIEFYKTDNSGNKKKLSENDDILGFESEEIRGNIKLELTKDIAIEDGTAGAPYLIRNDSDFREYIERTSNDYYYKLENNITVNGYNTVVFAGNFDANGHTIKFGTDVKNVKFTGILKGDLNIVGYGQYSQFLFFPIFYPFNIHLGQSFKIEEGSLNVYVDIDNSSINMDRAFISFFGASKFISLTVVGTHANDSADDVNFFFYKNDSEFDGKYNLTSITYLEDPNEEMSLTKKTSKFKNKKIEKVDSLEFEDSDDYSNPILKKGKSVEIDGFVVKDEYENFFIVDSNETEEEPNRIQYFLNDEDGYSADFSKLKMSYEDDNGASFPFYPFKNITSLSLRDAKEDPSGGTGVLQVLLLIGAILVLKGLDFEEVYEGSNSVRDIVIKTSESHDKDVVTTTAILKTQLTSLKEAIEALKNSLNQTLDDALANINGSVQTFTYIEDQRVGQDSKYNNDYSTNIKTNFANISGNIMKLHGDLGDSVEVNTSEEVKLIENTSKIIQQESVNLVLGLSESIVQINRAIESYLVLFDLNNLEADENGKMVLKAKNYGKDLSEFLNTTSYILRDLYNLNYKTFRVIRYGGFRSFDRWEEGFREFSNDGTITHCQIYIAQEMGLNAQNKSIKDRNPVPAALTYLVNDALIRMYKKSLITKDIPKKGENIFKYEAELEKLYSIIINLDASYEHTATTLLTKIPDLEKFDNIDIEGILNGTEFFDIILESAENHEDTSEKLEEAIDIRKIQNERLGNLIEMIFINDLFKEKTSSGIINRIIEISNIFNTCEKNFRNLLLDYYFNKVVNRIIIKANSFEKDEKDKSYFTESDLKILNGYFENPDMILYKKRMLVEKYMSVWMFKNFIHFGNGGSILGYIDGEAVTETINGKEMQIMKYPITKYLTTQSSDIPEDEHGWWEGVWDCICYAWNTFVDFLCNVWDGVVSFFN